MNPASIFAFVKAILPTKKIAAWILGLIGAALAVAMGVSNPELKAQYCASEVVSLPSTAPAAMPAADAAKVKALGEK
jgi:hypothetical protein